MLMIMPLSVTAGGLGYEIGENPFEQTSQAAEQAAKEGKLVLLIAGGDWCRWCHVLDSYLKHNKEIYKKLKQTFVITKVYIGEDNMNEEFFAQLPEAAGYPHFWVLSSEMDVIGEQDTGALEQGGNGYSSDRFQEFINHWRARL
jgi:thiol:disulfide interchange protein